jgi:hypothetical protein
VHGPRRVIGGNIERLEVVEIVFDFRPGLDRKAGLAE